MLKKSLFATLTVAVVSILLLGMTEGFLRWRKIARPHWDDYTPRYYYDADPIAGFIPRPSFSALHRHIQLTNNSHGLRDDEHALEKDPGVPRVLFVGDSQTWGARVYPFDVYARVVARELAGKSTPLEVLLGGVAGYASDQAFHRARTLAEIYHPDMIVAGIYLDRQYGDWPRLLAHEKFGVSRYYNGYLIPQYLFDRIHRNAVSRLFYSVYIHLRVRSHVLNLILEQDGRFGNHEFAVPLDAPNSPLFLEGKSLFEKHLKEMAAYCAEKKIRLVLVVIPSLPHLLELDDVNEATRKEVAALCRAYQVPLYDAHELLQPLAPTRPLYLLDGHLSFIGHEVLGKGLEDFLQKELSAFRRK